MKTFRRILHRRFERLQASYRKRADRLHHSLREIRGRGYAASLPRKPSVLFIGYAEAALGIGESFRYMLAALDTAGLSFSICPFSRNVESRIIGPFMERRYDRAAPYDITVAFMAVDQLPYCFDELSIQFAGSGYTILQTFWELPTAPQAWAPILERVDELWVPNSFVADAFRRIFSGTITTIPTCVEVTKPKNINSKEYFGLDKSRFYFMCSFDYYSGAARKNPLGAILAFAYAFPYLETNVGLVIKTTSPGELDPTVFHLLENFARLDRRIRVLNYFMEKDQMITLIDACDCYLSLHRSEGFGLGMAEAMALHKPVVGTDFSGNKEFLTEETGFPIPYLMRPLMRGEYPMGEGENWAEPDLEVAIDTMRSVFRDPREGRVRAQQGADLIAKYNSAGALTRVVDKRLREIRREKGFAEPTALIL